MFSISDSISSPLDFLAFFCFLVVGIETVRINNEFFNTENNSEAVCNSIFTSSASNELCPTQAEYQYIYSWGDDIHILYITSQEKWDHVIYYFTENVPTTAYY